MMKARNSTREHILGSPRPYCALFAPHNDLVTDAWYILVVYTGSGLLHGLRLLQFITVNQ